MTITPGANRHADEAFAAFGHEAQADRDLYGKPSAFMRMWTKDAKLYGPCGDFKDLKFNDKDRAPGGLSFKVPYSQPWIDYFYGQSKYAMRPITIDLPGYRTPWFVVAFGRVWHRGKRWIQVDAVHALEHYNWIRIFPDWYFPPEFQPSKEHISIGGACTVLKEQLAGNLIRLQGPLWAIPSGNLFDPNTWNLLRNAFWPMIVNPRRTGFFDTSKWTITTARMDKYMDIVDEVCRLENITPTIDWFIPGEDAQPFPEFAHLDRCTMVCDFVENDPGFAFTGTLIDGLIRTGLEMADDALEWITYPILGEDGWDDYLQKAAGTLPGKPIAVYRTGQYSTVGKLEEVVHVPMATRATGGGKSPTWINDIVVNTGNFIVGLIGAALGVPGLSLGVLTDRLKDALFAFHSVENLTLAAEAGPLRFKETFATSESTGLSLNTWASMWSSLWEVRGYESTLIEVTNGSPYWIGRDLRKGTPVGVERANSTVEVEYVREIHYEQKFAGVPGRFRLQIGEGDAEREPGSIALGKFRKLASTLTRVALGG
ncbi:Gp37-like protein [Rhodococcus pyridinivorans]|uniref:Gp28/Gp37-like domain-containing protein n=1 Tax=Rhodococcus pyridinivorans TaxID=103816 RepID=A0A7M2XRH4_9NOCA|nr:hypothetical protein [Rhodococcus pyridinivorans]QOV99501.1 hypothetical protein INP59_03615 [Rhodococcus pyridinivorans]